MIICVAAATKSMTANQTTKETFLQKELQDKIDLLSQKIVSLSDDMRAKYSTTRVIDTLVKEGLVTREITDGDLRAKKITITKKGIEFIEETMPNRQKITDEVMSCLTRNQMISLMGLLKKLKSHLLGIIAAKDPDLRGGVEIC